MIDAAFEARLRDLLDREAIRDVMMRYARGLDRMDDALALSCYWDDATEDHGHYVGSPGGFVAWVRAVSLSFVSTHHLIGNIGIMDIEDGNSHVESYYAFTGVREAAPHFLSTGRYIDHFQQRGGEWRIANRIVIVEGMHDLSGTAPLPGPAAYGPGEVRPATRDRTDASYQRPLKPRPHRRP